MDNSYEFNIHVVAFKIAPRYEYAGHGSESLQYVFQDFNLSLLS
jgi:hypothetical protein